LRLHVKEAWPQLWDTPTADVIDDDLLVVVAKLVENGTKRQAAKIRLPAGGLLRCH
jgi:hypothetical protein